MSAKEKKKISKVILFITFSIIILILLYFRYISNKESYAVDEENQKEQLKISNCAKIDVNEIIEKNSKNKHSKEEIYEKQEELEYITKYRNNNELYVGTTKVSQEGRNGIQTITMKKNYDSDGTFLNEEQVNCVVTKSSIDKIIEIGTKIYIEPEKKQENNSNTQITENIKLNEPSGFTAEQFKKALTDEKDVNKIFQNNSEYFYYIEEQYKINGIFVAAIGIHESSWGTSRLAKNKYNLFGYGAYDSNPYNGAYSFSNYSESIDLIARVLVKYYINPKGTKIYDGQAASGKYYNGNTISGVNKKYATDKNWGTSVYKWMKYLFDKVF